MKCPHCNKPLPAHIVDTRATGAKGGKSAGGDAKRRNREHYVTAGKKSVKARRLNALTVQKTGSEWAIFKTPLCKEIWEAPFATEQLAKLRLEYWKQNDSLQ